MTGKVRHFYYRRPVGKLVMIYVTSAELMPISSK